MLMGKRPKSITGVISRNRSKKIDDLSTPAQVLFSLLTLIVDIRYRQLYGESTGITDERDYMK